jgi:hypothetical protein
MNRTILALVTACALLLSVAAMADTGAPTTGTVANQLCKQEQKTMGATAFNTAYGTNASKSNSFGKCVAKNASNAQAAVDNAAKACKAERAAGAAAFTTKYGTHGKAGSNGAGANAYGKCVSLKASATALARAAAAPSAAKQCKAAAKADPVGYAGSYGKDKNALGKCVASTSHTR